MAETLKTSTSCSSNPCPSWQGPSACHQSRSLGDPVSKLPPHGIHNSQPPLPQIAETYAFLPREAVTRFLMTAWSVRRGCTLIPMAWSPGRSRWTVLETWGAVGQGSPPEGPALCWQEQESATTSSCHNAQGPAWVHGAAEPHFRFGLLLLFLTFF